ncbi:hypothetical protein BH18ACT10_BH18ACT10_16350 [soil metagenome]
MRRPAVVILSGIRWDFLWQRHQILATRFARAGYPTVFVETTGLSNPRMNPATVRKISARILHSGDRRPGVEPGLSVYAPLVAPPGSGVFRWANRRLFVPRVVRDLKKIRGPNPVIVAYPPTRTTLALISGLEPRLLYYDCSDDYENFPGVPPDIAATERDLFQRADIVSCTSPPLLEKARSLRPDAFMSGPGVDYERFAVLQGDPPDEAPTVGYFGHLDEARTDFDALREISGSGFRVRIVGGLGRVPRRFLETPGLDYRGEVPHEKLPAALAGVRAFVLPYRSNDLTRSISPAKTYECLATGKPVVAAPLPALAALGDHIYPARGAGEFVEILRNLDEIETDEKVRARISLARQNSWDSRFREIEDAICRRL